MSFTRINIEADFPATLLPDIHQDELHSVFTSFRAFEYVP